MSGMGPLLLPVTGSNDDYRKPQAVGDLEIIDILARMEAINSSGPGLTDLASSVGLSPFQLNRRLKRAVGDTLGNYQRRLRLGLAAALLTRSDHNILDIALQTGYGSQAAFNHAFARRYGLPPRKARLIARSKAPQPVLRHRAFADTTKPHRHHALPVLAMRFQGGYDHVPGYWRAFATMLRRAGVDLAGRQAVGIFYDDPGVTPEHLIRYDCCLLDHERLSERLAGPFRGDVVRSGEYASLDVAGPYSAVADAVFAICAVWMPMHRRRLTASPAYEFHRQAPWNDDGIIDASIFIGFE